MIYVGQHKTLNPYDNYMGSGVLIQKAISKYGKQNFKKDILFDFLTYEEMNAKEAEIVNDAFVQRDDTYNLMPGGANIGLTIRGRKLINNGNVQKYVLLIDLPKYIADGWELGLLPGSSFGKNNLGKHWVRNYSLNEQCMVSDEKLQAYLSIPGWELGQLPHEHPKLPMLSLKFQDYRSIFKDSIEKHVPYWEVDAYLLDGWQCGSKPSLNRTLFAKAMQDTRWMQKDKLFETKVWPNEINQYIEDGWTFGRIYHKHNKKHQPISEQQKQLYKDLWTGAKFMNDGTITRQVRKDQIELYCMLGWKFGGLKNQKRIYVNDGSINHSIMPSELSVYLAAGFKRGKIIKDITLFMKYKNGRYVHNITTHQNKMLRENEPLPAGYVEGLYKDEQTFKKLSLRTKGNRYIINDITGEVSHIKQGDPLPNGWHFGRHKRKLTDAQKENIHRKCSERTWYTNGKKNAMVPWGKEQPYIDAGWKKGRTSIKHI